MPSQTLIGPRISQSVPKLWKPIGRGTAELEAIRRFMLAQVPAGEGAAITEVAAGATPTPAQVTRSIRSAEDILALWYLRCELYQALLNVEGEEMAAEKLEPVTHQFAGLIPSPLRPRATSLGGPVAANVDEFLRVSDQDH